MLDIEHFSPTARRIFMPLIAVALIATSVSITWIPVQASHRRAAPFASLSSRDEASFLAINQLAMTTMMAGMNIRPSGDVDRDFVHMMVPHHQGAIAMAEAVLRYGRNETIRRLAQEIIVDQQQEIAAMRLAVGENLPPSRPAPTQSAMNMK